MADKGIEPRHKRTPSAQYAPRISERENGVADKGARAKQGIAGRWHGGFAGRKDAPFWVAYIIFAPDEARRGSYNLRLKHMYKILFTLLLALVAGGIWWLNRMDDEPYTTLAPADFSQLLTDSTDIQLVDVRMPDEYTETHLAGAKLFDVQNPLFLSKATSVLSQAHPVAVYCRSGKRSAQAARLLSEAGYRVYNLDGGILAWQNAALPVEP